MSGLHRSLERNVFDQTYMFSKIFQKKWRETLVLQIAQSQYEAKSPCSPQGDILFFKREALTLTF